MRPQCEECGRALDHAQVDGEHRLCDDCNPRCTGTFADDYSEDSFA